MIQTEEAARHELARAQAELEQYEQSLSWVRQLMEANPTMTLGEAITQLGLCKGCMIQGEPHVHGGQQPEKGGKS